MGGACLGGQPTSLHLHKCVARFGSDSAVQWRIQDFWKGAGGDEWPKTKIGWSVGRGALPQKIFEILLLKLRILVYSE